MSAYGPPERMRVTGEQALQDADPRSMRALSDAVIDALYDPALGDAASVNLGWVLDRIRNAPLFVTDTQTQTREALAEWLARQAANDR